MHVKDWLSPNSNVIMKANNSQLILSVVSLESLLRGPHLVIMENPRHLQLHEYI